jgi:hypothetical protein
VAQLDASGALDDADHATAKERLLAADPVQNGSACDPAPSAPPAAGGQMFGPYRLDG